VEITLSDKFSIETLSEVDDIIRYALENKDPEYAFKYCNGLVRGMKENGIKLSKTLWMLESNWKQFDTGDEFVPTALDYMEIHEHTITRYVRVWEMFTHYIPESSKDRLIERPMNVLIPVANAISQGYEIGDDVWKKLETSSQEEVREFVREIKGTEPRKSALTLKLDTEGSIYGITNDGYYFIGSLEIKDDSEIVQKAIERIVSNAGILRNY